jgi:hypothetical protein
MPHFAAWAAGEACADRDTVIVHVRDRVFSASPTYLERGLDVGVSLHRARMLFPRARFLARDLPAEQIYADRLLDRLYQLSPQVALIEDRNLVGWWAALQGFSPEGLSDVLREFLAQGGSARLQPHAMLAALYAPAGQLHAPSTPREFFCAAPIQRLSELGISPKTLELLQFVGMSTLADLRRLTLRHLQAQFGKEGRHLFGLLHPSAHPTRVPHYTPLSVTVTRAISWTLCSTVEFQPYLEALIQAACERISALAPTWMRLKITQHGGGAAEHFKALKPPFTDVGALHGPALYLLHQGLERVSEEQPVTQLALTLGGLVQARPVQGSLFTSRPPWHAARANLLRRFPHRLFQPTRNTDAPFLPEEEFSLGALVD